jgi:hypothetical protein
MNSSAPDPFDPTEHVANPTKTAIDPTENVATTPASIAPTTASASGFPIAEIFFGPDGLRAGWGILLFVALCVLLFFCMNLLQTLLFPRSFGAVAFNTPRGLLTSEGRALIVATLASLAMAKIERRSIAAYGFAHNRGLRNFANGIGCGLALLSLLVFSLRALGLLVFDARLLRGVDAMRYGAVWLLGFLLVGLLEEMLFRGYLQFTLARGINGLYRWLSAAPRATGLHAAVPNAVGFWAAALLISFGFGFSHHTNAGESPIGLLAAALIGVVFCLSLWRTGSLWWAIGFHAAWDWAQSFLYGVADSGTTVVGHLFATHPVGRTILSGGLTGPEGSIYILPIIALTVAAIFFTLPRSPRDEPAAAVPRDPLGGLD